ncbi:tRNA (adenosine(37)-N6)-dimethylallyltransferase MiaA, partial [bacterium]|nr:tRNA (adenosine(37)-N6)-dimethylallyltransferase MiaA [bacterium]
MGPTASGKSEVAMALARRVGAEIVSVDSMQVYRGMDIGTAKPSPEDRSMVRHHLLDIADPADEFSVADFQTTGRSALADLAARDVPVLIVGGSGLHFRSLVDPLDFPPTDPRIRAGIEAMSAGACVVALVEADPTAGDVVDLANPRRVVRALEVFRITGDTPTGRATTPDAEAVRTYQSVVPIAVVGFDPGDSLPERVGGRFDAMLDRGLVDEIAALAPTLGRTARAAVGYRQLMPVVAGERSL